MTSEINSQRQLPEGIGSKEKPAWKRCSAEDSKGPVISVRPNNVQTAKLRPGIRAWRYAPVLLPLMLLIGTGLRGLDFGLHWDERPWQIGPVKTMVQSHTLLPGYYNYPSFDYWLNLLVLAPDVVTPRVGGESLIQHLLRTLD